MLKLDPRRKPASTMGRYCTYVFCRMAELQNGRIQSILPSCNPAILQLHCFACQRRLRSTSPRRWTSPRSTTPSTKPRKETRQRYDFKGATAEITLNVTEKTLTLLADDEMKMNAVWEIVQTRLTRRNVPVKNFKDAPSEPAAGGKLRRVITIQQ